MIRQPITLTPENLYFIEIYGYNILRQLNRWLPSVVTGQSIIKWQMHDFKAQSLKIYCLLIEFCQFQICRVQCQESWLLSCLSHIYQQLLTLERMFQGTGNQNIHKLWLLMIYLTCKCIYHYIRVRWDWVQCYATCIRDNWNVSPRVLLLFKFPGIVQLAERDILKMNSLKLEIQGLHSTYTSPSLNHTGWKKTGEVLTSWCECSTLNIIVLWCYWIKRSDGRLILIRVFLM